MLLAVLGACQVPTADSSGFSSTPGVTTVPGSTGTTAADSTGTTAGNSSTSSGASSSGESGVSETTQPVLDVGTVADVGGGNPVGCEGKIDLPVRRW